MSGPYDDFARIEIEDHTATVKLGSGDPINWWIPAASVPEVQVNGIDIIPEKTRNGVIRLEGRLTIADEDGPTNIIQVDA